MHFVFPADYLLQFPQTHNQVMKFRTCSKPLQYRGDKSRKNCYWFTFVIFIATSGMAKIALKSVMAIAPEIIYVNTLLAALLTVQSGISESRNGKI